IKEENLEPRVARDYIGGRGLGAYYLNREADPTCDPLSAENMMVMAAGPLTGTTAPTASRYMVMTKGPLTNAITCSNSGGHFPKELKWAGYDALIITGRSPEPVYLWIEQGKAEIRPARHLWGKWVPETTDALLKETDPKARVACIGPSGEKLVLFAAIMNEKDRAAGRSGVGAVMGSKNLKAIVVRGNDPVPVANKDRFAQVHNQLMTKFREGVKQNGPSPLSQHGTIGVMTPLTQKHGVLPTKNWQQGTFDQWESITGQTLTKKYLVKTRACWSCPLACARVTKINERGYEGEGEGPEFETGYALGALCMVDDLAAITKANYYCNELGLDTITMGATVSCAMELFQRGYLTEKDAGGPVKWGDAARMVELVKMTGLREGFGDQLALGSYRLAERYGHPELAMVSKKLEMPGYDPRGLQGQGLNYATSPIGASHCRAHMGYPEMVGIPKLVDAHEWKGKGKLVKTWQDVFGVIDAAGLCIFFGARNMVRPELDIRPDIILDYLNAVTGAEYSIEELTRAGERILNAERQFLVKAGFSRKDDTLPPRLLQEPHTSGPAQGRVVHLDEMLDEYYRERGWSPDGIPTAAKLKELGIEKL
ncbi:MAG TPA: aldehyde ferredoxin oxidoreductase family protein, partial [Thermodesulfobacteriota bacterium]|nr:aldehyde ferredoxin oxidoreductase family protein [Thermodesulfobacteriota bacterium]